MNWSECIALLLTRGSLIEQFSITMLLFWILLKIHQIRKKMTLRFWFICLRGSPALPASQYSCQYWWVAATFRPQFLQTLRFELASLSHDHRLVRLAVIYLYFVFNCPALRYQNWLRCFRVVWDAAVGPVSGWERLFLGLIKASVPPLELDHYEPLIIWLVGRLC